MITVKISFNGTATVELKGTEAKDRTLLELAFTGNDVIGVAHTEGGVALTLGKRDATDKG